METGSHWTACATTFLRTNSGVLAGYGQLAGASVCENKPRTVPKSREASGTAWAHCSGCVSLHDFDADRRAARLRCRYGLSPSVAYVIADLAYA